MSDLRREIVMDDHLVEVAILVHRYATNVQAGLTANQVAINQNLFGFNKLTPPPVTSEWVRYHS